jgi:hypothetical protein
MRLHGGFPFGREAHVGRIPGDRNRRMEMCEADGDACHDQRLARRAKRIAHVENITQAPIHAVHPGDPEPTSSSMREVVKFGTPFSGRGCSS